MKNLFRLLILGLLLLVALPAQANRETLVQWPDDVEPGWPQFWRSLRIDDWPLAMPEWIISPPAGTLGGPQAGLDWATTVDYYCGHFLFRQRFDVAHGLGPYYNSTACGECHYTPNQGGRGEDMMRQGILVHGPAFTEKNAMGLRKYSIPGFKQELGTPPVGHLRTPPLYGLGELDEIPDETIEQGQDPQDLNHDGITGMVNRRGDGMRMARFGQKANEWNLQRFCAGALRDEMGVTSPQNRDQRPDGDAVPDPEVAADFVPRVAAFVRHLARPPRGPSGEAAKRGEATFVELGCSGCHKPQLGQVYGAYTDLLLHDMGGSLDNHLHDGLAKGVHWRTSPLWGLRFKERFLHDERAASVPEVLDNHQGEAALPAARFKQLSPTAKADLVAFLYSL